MRELEKEKWGLFSWRIHWSPKGFPSSQRLAVRNEGQKWIERENERMRGRMREKERENEKERMREKERENERDLCDCITPVLMRGGTKGVRFLKTERDRTAKGYQGINYEWWWFFPRRKSCSSLTLFPPFSLSSLSSSILSPFSPLLLPPVQVRLSFSLSKERTNWLTEARYSKVSIEEWERKYSERERERQGRKEERGKERREWEETWSRFSTHFVPGFEGEKMKKLSETERSKELLLLLNLKREVEPSHHLCTVYF